MELLQEERLIHHHQAHDLKDLIDYRSTSLMKTPPRRTLQYDHAKALLVIIGGGRFLMSEAPL